MEDITSFGEWLRRRRKALDLTQAALADRAGCVPGTIKSIEADARRPSRQLAERLADCLDLAPDERAAFLKAARAELSPDQLASPTQLVTRAVGSAVAPPLADAHQRALPTGTVTFLFTDIEGSTQLWEHHPQAMQAALARHDAILVDAITAQSGVVVKRTGDGVLAAFPQAPHALTAAFEVQRALQAADWGAIGQLRVRMALHTGSVEVRQGDYFGQPLNRAARLLAVGHGSQILLSRATAELLHDHLPGDVELRDLGQHRLKDLSRPEHIFQLVAPDVPADFPPLKTLDARRTNLPAQPTTLIGRAQEIASVCTLLRADARLVTLTGPGGTGKTRLAVQVAAELLDTFADGVWFVDLAPISNPELVIATIMQTLGLKEIGGQPPLEQLKAYLRDKQVLLVLDNFEQVVDAAPRVAELLAVAPQLKVLITSRVVLRLRGEQEYAVPPLALPNPKQLPPLEALSQYAAVELFIQRAQDVKLAFQVTNANAPAVAEICARLDGLPLAIELAAARVKLFAPEALLVRLERRLGLLTAGRRDVPARQQTIRNTIDWSYQLLEDAEKMLFARLGVFVGGCTIEAAETVCDAAGDLRIDALDGLAALVDQSLLKQVEGANGDPRFVMLETIREYALEQLDASGEIEALRQRHAAYFLAFAQAADPQLHKPEQAMWLARLEAEHDNLRAVLKWAVDTLEIDFGLRLAGTLGWFWHVHDHFSEGRSWLARLLKLAASYNVPLGARVKSLGAAGTLAAKQSDFAAAVELLEASLALAREVDDKPGIAYALGVLGWQAVMQNDYARAVVLSEQSLRLYRDIGDKWGIAQALWNLGRVMDIQGNYEQATTYFDESLTVWQEAGDTRGIATVLNQQALLAQRRGNYDRARHLFEQSLQLYCELEETWGAARSRFHLARVAQYQGEYGQAVAVLEESLALFQKLGDKENTALSLIALGNIAFEQGNYAQSLAFGKESLMLCQELGNKDAIAMSLEGLAAVAGVRSQPGRAARLLGAAIALRETIGAPLSPSEYPRYERTLATGRAQLDEATWAAAWAEGRAMSLEQAIAEALEQGSADTLER